MVEIDKKKKRSLPSMNMNKVKFLFASKFRLTPQFIMKL